jgi:hypothetical protein
MVDPASALHPTSVMLLDHPAKRISERETDLRGSFNAHLRHIRVESNRQVRMQGGTESTDFELGSLCQMFSGEFT